MARRSKDAQRMWRLAARYSSVGIQMALCVAIGVLAGVFGDRHFGTEPYLFWAGLAVGVTAAVRSVWRVVKSTKLEDL